MWLFATIRSSLKGCGRQSVASRHPAWSLAVMMVTTLRPVVYDGLADGFESLGELAAAVI